MRSLSPFWLPGDSVVAAVSADGRRDLGQSGPEAGETVGPSIPGWGGPSTRRKEKAAAKWASSASPAMS